ncbi:hypothetical protein Aduo_017231 [Ancylostoma duodenale]
MVLHTDGWLVLHTSDGVAHGSLFLQLLHGDCPRIFPSEQDITKTCYRGLLDANNTSAYYIWERKTTRSQSEMRKMHAEQIR